MGQVRQEFVHDQYTVAHRADNRDADKVVCKHCGQHSLVRHVPRMKKHLLTCPDTPDDVRAEIHAGASEAGTPMPKVVVKREEGRKRKRGMRSGKPVGLVWEHCVDTERKTSSGMNIKACIYCNKDVGAGPAYATQHMTDHCEAIPEEVREQFRPKQNPSWMDEGTEDEDDDDSDDNDAESSSAMRGTEQEKVVKILTGLLTQVNNGEPDNKKKLKHCTDADLERELKELAVKEARLRVKDLEDQQRERSERTKMYQDVRKGFRSIASAVQVWATNGTGTASSNQTNILQAAYDESIATTPGHASE